MVRLLDFKEQAAETLDDGEENVVSYIALELANRGALYEMFAKGNFSPEISRYYFRQMLNAIHYMHQQGVAHRDLKL